MRDLHGADVPEPTARTVTFLEPTDGAVVLGSTQSDDVVDRASAAAGGLDVVRRRTGGGAVLVRPGELVWADVTVPAADGLWHPDVTRSFEWLGDTWAGALEDLGLASRPHRGPLVRSRWSSLVCFAGLGPGEVTVEGRKALGLAQRRTRAGSRFQCAALLAWRPVDLVDVLALSGEERAAAALDLEPAAAGVAPRISAPELEGAFLERLA